MYSYTKSERKGHLRMLLEMPREERLHLKSSKCGFWLRNVKVLGYVLETKKFRLTLLRMEEEMR